MSGTFQGIGTLQFTPDNKHAYAYSGEFDGAAGTAPTIRLQFETGSYYLVGKIRSAGMSDMGSPSSGNVLATRVYFNGTLFDGTEIKNVVLTFKTDGASEDMPYADEADIIIPPFTLVTCVTDMDSASASQDGTIAFTGKVLGTVEQFDLELK